MCQEVEAWASKLLEEHRFSDFDIDTLTEKFNEGLISIGIIFFGKGEASHNFAKTHSEIIKHRAAIRLKLFSSASGSFLNKIFAFWVADTKLKKITTVIRNNKKRAERKKKTVGKTN